jgi:hypothetical protein|tara:strand:+ start:991 stop:1431 length:441 start_codon:yes stop_codon:yes gene_type:complete
MNENDFNNLLTDHKLYCLHYLLPGNKLLNDKDFASYFNNLKYKYYILPSNHLCIHILDSIHYNVLSGKVSFNLYGKYVTITKQPEHSVEQFKNLIRDFDINKMKNIEFYKKTIENDDKFIISDGCHRLSILLFSNYSNIHEYVTLK